MTGSCQLAKRMLRSGTDVTITTFSIMVGRALQAADLLAEQGISAEVIDLRTIRPLDCDTIVGSVKKTSRLIACEEGSLLLVSAPRLRCRLWNGI